MGGGVVFTEEGWEGKNANMKIDEDLLKKARLLKLKCLNGR
jgi:hypothetical protein